jgi:hypothetical protein
MRPHLPLLCLSLLGFLQTSSLKSEPAKAPVPPALQPASISTAPGMPAVEPGAFSIVVLPDTQFYAQLHPEIFHQQTQWIADNIKRYDTRFVLQLGDITQTAVPAEWNVARKAFATLTGKVPFSLAPGNHDYAGKNEELTHRSPMSEFLPVALFKAMPTFAGVYDAEPEKSDNQCHTFEAGGRKWLVVALEYAPRTDVLRWAGDVVSKHPDHTTIVITHAYLSPKTNQRFRTTVRSGTQAAAPAPDLNQGEEIWQKFVSKHANIAFVLSGHACYTSRRTDTGASGNTVHEMVVDYQQDVNGGNGWLRLLQILPDGKTIRSREYSPTLDQTSTMPDRTFDFQIGESQR